ncbi:Hsp20/alpha crystallin family protein [Bacillus sp. BRMEA1]|uniref:Hsp20/alpha crystallin family protein n=1 Tax=Neobacillus endophyticus TaxID=2738405 RepID=UPI0015647246|nr:Hsp20/alpha crystallin family protein [Neobacillus endophyticus]NRD80423.1 Hsp20/alpha crystallin family protein [Neobacillus endophyticus]
MDMDKLKQWLELAKNMQGSDFWSNVFDQEFAKQFINDEQFNSPFTNTTGQSFREGQTSKSFPIIDILEGEEEVFVIIELPGIIKENIQLGLNGNVLSIKGKAVPVHPHLHTAYSERFYGDFQRQITLPDHVNPSEINAKFWNGLLIVRYKRNNMKGEIIPIE